MQEPPTGGSDSIFPVPAQAGLPGVSGQADTEPLGKDAIASGPPEADDTFMNNAGHAFG